jgi:uncharacterized protein (DUF1810 family)
MADTFHLQRFVDAQAPVFDTVCAELRAAAKRSHWMWFVFPQLRGLGQSQKATYYGLASADEARAYWHHPVLGPRLQQCVALLLAAPAGCSARAMLGSPDDLKLRSCLTLFAEVAPEAPEFTAALQRFHGGLPDPRTLALLAGAGEP